MLIDKTAVAIDSIHLFPYYVVVEIYLLLFNY